MRLDTSAPRGLSPKRTEQAPGPAEDRAVMGRGSPGHGPHGPRKPDRRYARTQGRVLANDPQDIKLNLKDAEAWPRLRTAGGLELCLGSKRVEGLRLRDLRLTCASQLPPPHPPALPNAGGCGLTAWPGDSDRESKQRIRQQSRVTAGAGRQPLHTSTAPCHNCRHTICVNISALAAYMVTLTCSLPELSPSDTSKLSRYAPMHSVDSPGNRVRLLAPQSLTRHSIPHHSFPTSRVHQ